MSIARCCTVVRPNRTTVRGLVLVALILSVASCGSSSPPAKSTAPAPDDQSVAHESTSLLTPFDLVVQRSSVSEKPGALGGSELFLYAQPRRTEAAAVYAGRFTPLAAAIVPKLFATYPAITWIDLCQEPAKSSGTWETTPVTRLEISRQGSGRVDWQHADLARLLALTRTRPLEVSIEWHNGVGGTPVWSAAAARSLNLSG